MANAKVVQVVERETETQAVNSKVTVVGSSPTLCTRPFLAVLLKGSNIELSVSGKRE